VIAKGKIVASGTAAGIGERATNDATIRITLPAGLSCEDLPPAVTSALAARPNGKVKARSPSPLVLLGELAD
jgi:hypothetical protein